MIDKKELKRKYLQTPPEMGIYQIRNLVNNKVFVCSGLNLKGKSNSYKFQLNSGLHYNSELQKDFNQYGENNFVFEILDTLEPKEGTNYKYDDDLKTLLELWIEKLQPFGERGYNIKIQNS